MEKAKPKSLNRFLSALLAIVMLLAAGAINASAAESITREAVHLGVPSDVEDGVYYAEVNMKNASIPTQYSMGNASLRGSESYKQKQPGDTAYRPIVIVENGKATALLEYMPMGFIGMYGFMMELEGIYPASFTQYGMPNANDSGTIFTKTQTITYQKTVNGDIVYDGYNNPESDYKFDGNKLRPAGYGKPESYVNIVDQPYSHLLSLDVTPVMVKDDDEPIPEKAADYTYEHAAFCHVFVPVMFDISASSGDQFARMEVNWTTLEKIDNPTENVEYMLWKAKNTDVDGYTSASISAFESAYNEVHDAMENVWAKQTLEMNGSGFAAQPVLDLKEYSTAEKQAMAKKLADAIDGLAEKADKTALDEKISEANAILKESGELYTEESVQKLNDAISAARALTDDTDQKTANEAEAAIDAAIKGLVYRDADYSAVNAALASIPSDLSIYTDESVKAVEDAKAAVVSGKNITEQSEVDAMAKAINDAVAALVKKDAGDQPAYDFEKLPNGVYSIEFTMVKMNRGDLSMSNDAVNHTAKLTVKDGNYTIEMNFKGLHYLNRFGYLAKLSYYEDGYTYGEYGSVNGTLKAADVLSVQKNPDGSDVTDEFNIAGGIAEGMKYPETISFPLVSNAIADKDGFVPLHVFVPVMEDISAGTGDQDVLMKLDLSTLKKADDNDPAFEPEKPEELSPAVDITDEKTGVKISADKGVLPDGATIAVKEITSGKEYDDATSALSDSGKKFKLYEIVFKDKDGKEIQPNGSVSISFPAPADYNTESLALYRINSDGSKTLVKGALADGFYTSSAKTPGIYALAAEIKADGGNQNPQTGDKSGFAILSALAAVSMGMLALTAAKKRRLGKGE